MLSPNFVLNVMEAEEIACARDGGGYDEKKTEKNAGETLPAASVISPGNGDEEGRKGFC